MIYTNYLRNVAVGKDAGNNLINGMAQLKYSLINTILRGLFIFVILNGAC